MGVTFSSIFFFFPSVFLGFARENTIFLRVLCHLVFPRENTIFLRIPCHFLRLFLVFRRESTILLFSYGFRVISLDFQIENIRYLGYSSGKSDFPDIFAFFRFSQGNHTLPWLFLGKIRFC